MVDKGIHGKVIVITAILNDFLDSGKRLVISCVDYCRYRIGHFRVGRFQRDSFCGRNPVQAKHTVQNDTWDGADENDDNQEEKADADQNLEQAVAHCPRGGKNCAPRASGGSACGDFSDGFAAFRTGLHHCGGRICCCFRTFYGCLCGSIMRDLLCCLNRFPGSLTEIVLTIADLIFFRLGHGITSILE